MTDAPTFSIPNDAGPAAWSAPVWIDDCGLLHVGRRWVVLPEVEWRLMQPLVARFGMTVRRETLIDAAWPDQKDKEAALNVRIGSARRRIESVGLRITNVRGRGYVLDHQQSG